jgi:hypothetical protein
VTDRPDVIAGDGLWKARTAQDRVYDSTLSFPYVLEERAPPPPEMCSEYLRGDVSPVFSQKKFPKAGAEMRSV